VNTAKIDYGIMVLQNCLDLPKVEPGSYSETCLTSSDDERQILGMNVKEVTNVQEEEDPLLISHPVMKAEHEVSCVCMLCFCLSIVLHISQIFGIAYSYLHLACPFI
jgi:hypothetical protein